MAIPTGLRLLLQRFRDDARGVAAIEFAMVFPIMIILYAGAVEASALLSIDRRVQTVASTLGDLVSRSNKQIAACDLKVLFLASGGIMAPYSTGRLQQVVSAVLVNPDGSSAEVKWSVPNGGAVAHAVGTAFTLPKAMRDISKGSYVIVAEASYSYQPMTHIVYDKDIDWRRENFFLPRFATPIDINPTSLADCPD